MLAEGCTSHDGLLNFKSGMASNENTVGWNERKKKCKRNSKLCTVNVVNSNIQFRRFVVSKYSWNHLMSSSQIWIVLINKKAVFLRLGVIFTFWHENKKRLFGLPLFLEMIINLPLAKHRAYFAICKFAGIILNMKKSV